MELHQCNVWDVIQTEIEAILHLVKGMTIYRTRVSVVFDVFFVDILLFFVFEENVENIHRKPQGRFKVTVFCIVVIRV